MSLSDRHDTAIDNHLLTPHTSAKTALDDEHECNLRLRDSREGCRDVRRELRWPGSARWARMRSRTHEATVLGRADDHAGAALAYYGSRGETPLRWAGTGAVILGLFGEVTPAAYEAAFGPAGSVSHRAVTGWSRRAGLGSSWWFLRTSRSRCSACRARRTRCTRSSTSKLRRRWTGWTAGSRNGAAGEAGPGTRTATGGLTYAVTRHATSRAGDPSPHDHVLVANVVEMLDETGGWKALDSAALRDTVEAATMVGRLHSAAWAVELGFDIALDDGPSGHLRHWRIVGIPDAVCEVFSKRSADIAVHLARTGQNGYRARGVAARATRSVKRHTGVDELLPTWHQELATVGWPVERLVEYLTQSLHGSRMLRFPLTTGEIDRLASEVLDVDGRLLANHKIFTRTQLVAELAPHLYGRDPSELDRVLEHVVTSRGSYRLSVSPVPASRLTRPSRSSPPKPPSPRSSKRSPPEPAPLSTRIR